MRIWVFQYCENGVWSPVDEWHSNNSLTIFESIFASVIQASFSTFKSLINFAYLSFCSWLSFSWLRRVRAKFSLSSENNWKLHRQWLGMTYWYLRLYACCRRDDCSFARTESFRLSRIRKALSNTILLVSSSRWFVMRIFFASYSSLDNFRNDFSYLISKSWVAMIIFWMTEPDHCTELVLERISCWGLHSSRNSSAFLFQKMNRNQNIASIPW